MSFCEAAIHSYDSYELFLVKKAYLIDLPATYIILDDLPSQGVLGVNKCRKGKVTERLLMLI